MKALSKFCSLMVAVAVMAALCACGGESSVSRRFPCHFTFYTEWHPTSMIVTSLGTYNYYVRISMTPNNGAYIVNVADSKGKKEQTRLTNDLENLAFSSGIYLGAGAAKGFLIVGMTNFNGYVAWDGQCPNCATGYTTRYPLEWTDNATTVVCNTCHRKYSLETGAILSGNKGDRLMSYIVSYVPNGVLGIGN